MGRAPFLEIDGQALHRIAGRWRVPLLFYTVTGRSEQACSMPPRYAFCLEDLRVFHLVRANCHACGHKAVIPNVALLQGRPGYTRLMALKRHLRCRKCGVRAGRRSMWNFGRGIEIQERLPGRNGGSRRGRDQGSERKDTIALVDCNRSEWPDCGRRQKFKSHHPRFSSR